MAAGNQKLLADYQIPTKGCLVDNLENLLTFTPANKFEFELPAWGCRVDWELFKLDFWTDYNLNRIWVWIKTQALPKRLIQTAL